MYVYCLTGSFCATGANWSDFSSYYCGGLFETIGSASPCSDTDLWTENKLVPAGVFSARLPDESVALDTQLVEFGQHSRQQLFGRPGADTGSLQIKNLFAVSGNLPTASFNIRAEKLQIHVPAPCSAI
jgi:hypothetical protein